MQQESCSLITSAVRDDDYSVANTLLTTASSYLTTTTNSRKRKSFSIEGGSSNGGSSEDSSALINSNTTSTVKISHQIQSFARLFNATLHKKYFRNLISQNRCNPFSFIKELPEPKHRGSFSIKIPKKREERMTLVLDLDETLVHCGIEPMKNAEIVFPVTMNDVNYVVYARIRPHVREFLTFVSQHFEVIVFTASQKIYADKLLDLLDPQQEYFHHRLFRDSCVPVNGNFVKDLACLNRDMARMCIIDNSPHAFGFHLENGIPIESWFEDESDEGLKDIIPFLEELRTVVDVRPILRNVFRLHELVELAA